jgi:hypothetical protein
VFISLDGAGLEICTKTTFFVKRSRRYFFQNVFCSDSKGTKTRFTLLKMFQQSFNLSILSAEAEQLNKKSLFLLIILCEIFSKHKEKIEKVFSKIAFSTKKFRKQKKLGFLFQALMNGKSFFISTQVFPFISVYKLHEFSGCHKIQPYQ